MIRNPFKVLGVKDTVTQTELDDAYREAIKPYEELRFEEGERGDAACRKLTELHDAYDEASRIIASQYVVDDDDATLIRDAENLLKEVKLEDAQAKLNKVRDRNAQWHFLQSGLYFRRGWQGEALAELKIAVTMDPQNVVYQTTYQNVVKKMNGVGAGAGRNGFYENRQNGANPNRSYYGNDNPYGYNNRRGMDACDCCSSLICADCCCECMGGDLISCC